MLLLIRHASTDATGVCLSARTPGVHLNDNGRGEAELLRSRLARAPLSAIYSSPLERAIETAQPIARDHALDVETMEELNEVDFGDWSGRSFDELSIRPDWRRFNERRAAAPVPNGESALDVQRRIVAALDGLRALHCGSTVAAVTHAEVIRLAVLHILAAPINAWQRVEISPASVTAIVFDDGQPRLLTVNAPPGRDGHGPGE
jgi:probable phosphoglycerate mutase